MFLYFRISYVLCREREVQEPEARVYFYRDAEVLYLVVISFFFKSLWGKTAEVAVEKFYFFRLPFRLFSASENEMEAVQISM